MNKQSANFETIENEKKPIARSANNKRLTASEFGGCE